MRGPIKGNMQNLSIAGYECKLYLPPKYYINDVNYPVAYINGEGSIQEIMEEVECHFGIDCSEFIVIGVISQDWNEDFTPWAAPPLSKKSEPFKGGASSYINSLVDTIKPFIDVHYKTKPDPSNTALIGHSLGGLTALYSLYTISAFGMIGSISGSLWYDGWIEFMDSHRISNEFSRVYLSLGKGEEHSRNLRMAKVGNCTREASIILKDQLESKENVILEWNEGGHFSELPNRLKRALLWLMS
ncbi:alpha/beta hydrolase [Clostridium sp. CS001]|uniref:alpha/beta hydrolase n=1 Tax=Clostridium sp. CS001 TaxID=2880648 RepID=UPI001CF294D7|nr:alpha/beta hydrolase-fold protein [Clostridium sp. CS001]MCB2288192.1 alpha/beta hydrolase [Clostridium sp. CS001]